MSESFILEIKFEDLINIPSQKFGELNWSIFENKKIINIFAGKLEKFFTRISQKDWRSGGYIYD